MQLLYGNDGINYCTIAKSPEISSAQEREILKYEGYQFVSNSAQYSSAATEPVDLCCIVSNFSRTFEKDMLLLGKCARMSNFVTPSYCCHFYINELNKDILGKNFLSLLKKSFIKDVDLVGYKENPIDSFTGVEDSSVVLDTDAFTKEQKIALVAKILSAADSIAKQVAIVLDVEGDAYNKRALDVIATIYKYIPYGIRKNVGFSTYAGAGNSSSNRVKLQLYTRDVIGADGIQYIDLANMDVSVICRDVEKEFIIFAKELVDRSDEELERLFGWFEKTLGFLNTSVSDHFTLLTKFSAWNSSDLQEILDDLAKTAYQEYQKSEESPVFKYFKAVINDRFERTGFVNNFQDILKGLIQTQKDFNFEKRLKAYIILGEVLPCVSFSSALLIPWIEERWIKEYEIKYENYDLLRRLESLNNAVSKTQIGGPKFLAILSETNKYVQSKVDRLKEEIERKTAEEAEQIKKEVVHIIDLKEDLNARLKALYDRITFTQDNQQVFIESSVLMLGDIFKRVIIKRYKEYEFVKQMLEAFGNEFSVPKEDMDRLNGQLDMKGEVVRKMEEYKMIAWNKRDDIIDAYIHIAKMEAVSEGKDVVVPDYSLNVGGTDYTLKSDELKALCGFLMAPQKNNIRNVEVIFSKEGNDGLFDDLIMLKVFTESHYQYLMDMRFMTEKTKDILEYYCQSDSLLSTDDIEFSLKKLDTNELSKLSNSYRLKSNIVTKVLEEKIAATKESKEKRLSSSGEFDIILEKKDPFNEKNDTSLYGKSKNLSYEEPNRKSNEEQKYKSTVKSIKKEVSPIPGIVLFATIIPALSFLIEGLIAVKRSSLLWPGVMSGSAFVLGIVVFILKLFFDGIEDKYGFLRGTMVGLFCSIITVWCSWFLFK